MNTSTFVLIYSIYGLAFYSLGLALLLEGGRGSDIRLRRALRPLAAFAFVHAAHEWMEAFERLNLLPGQDTYPELWYAFRLGLLVFSFLSLAAFGAQLFYRRKPLAHQPARPDRPGGPLGYRLTVHERFTIHRRRAV